MLLHTKSHQASANVMLHIEFIMQDDQIVITNSHLVWKKIPHM